MQTFYAELTIQKSETHYPLAIKFEADGMVNAMQLLAYWARLVEALTLLTVNIESLTTSKRRGSNPIDLLARDLLYNALMGIKA